ncbi:hypothetical protein NW762_010771 [Fusarium torreyae]|uniref:Uncharacterized protein n=1 Tax=Fusarium torreyae TaxID=1237075 RepID=A0A9W8RT62_9HYPO|nr:hypothetical protein NW762_010771 [Fusarium torreyae]
MDKNQQATTLPDLAPPSYDNYRLDSEEFNAPSQISSQPKGSTIKFPPKLIFNVRWLSTTSFLGPTKDEPLFAVRTPNKLTHCMGRGQILLRDGLDKLSPAIASVGPEKGSFLTRSLIRVAPKPCATNQEHVEISMSGDWTRRHEFSLRLDSGKTERFEWRNSRGDEVRNLSGGYSFGWKLVRLDSTPVIPGSPGTSWGYTSDGKEVVAVGAHPRFFHKSPEFTFLGAGACGDLGETFEIVAVMGFLRLYELAVQYSSINTSVVASSTSVLVIA